MMRGMLPPSEIKLELRNYLVRPVLPAVPRVFGHLHAAQPPGGWGMLGNNHYGNCVMAGAAHEAMLWAWATRSPIPRFDERTVVRQYLALTGGEDTGLDPTKAAAWRQSSGIVDADNHAHRISAYVLVQGIEELALATYLFGATGMMWDLPATAEQQFTYGSVWDDTTSAPDNRGHYTPCGGRNSDGRLMFVTWGRIQAATDAYVDKFMYPGKIAVAYLSREYLMATGKSPEAIAWDDLAADLAAIGQGG